MELCTIGRVTDLNARLTTCTGNTIRIRIYDNYVGEHVIVNIAAQCHNSIVLEHHGFVRIAFVER